jgi:modification methylase
VKAGAILTDKKRKFKATIRADGSLLCGTHQGSIHKVGSLVQDAPSCNGWTYWYIEDASGDMQPVDTIRQTYLLATEP